MIAKRQRYKVTASIQEFKVIDIVGEVVTIELNRKTYTYSMQYMLDQIEQGKIKRMLSVKKTPVKYVMTEFVRGYLIERERIFKEMGVENCYEEYLGMYKGN